MTVSQNSIQIPCRLHARPIQTSVNLSSVSKVFSRRKGASILGGNGSKAEGDGFSYWAAGPTDVFEFTGGQDEPFEQLASLLAKYTLDRAGELPPIPFLGGWVGYFGYELGRYIEKLPETTVDDIGLPLIRLCFYDRLMVYDHRQAAFWALALEMPDDTKTPRQKLASVEAILTEAREEPIIEPPAGDVEDVDISAVHSNFARDDYLRTIERAKQYIRDGEIYQVNLSQRFDRPFHGRAIDLFHWQNHHNPSPYAAYIDMDGTQIVSASPEMFVTIEDGRIQTKPIKGTRPRLAHHDPSSHEINERNRTTLLNCAKEQAELNMIVDLERNDLARICRPGTRRVIEPRTIEAYPTVFHAVATVGGQLRPDIEFCEMLKAVFPGGSITGAPKIRAMQVIDELEPTTRGVYTGSIGFIGLDGTACLNIAIRTVIITARQAFVQSGGGIVADSRPAAEWDETIAKARALLAGIAAVQKY